MSHTASRAGQFLKQRLWVWPLIAIALLTLVGFGVRGAIERTMKQSLLSSLQTLLNVEVAMLETWLDAQENNAESLANDAEVRSLVARILADGDDAGDAAAKLAEKLAPAMASHDYTGYLVVDKRQLVVASSEEELIGREDVPQFGGFLSKVLEGQGVVSRPLPSVVSLKDHLGRRRTETPTMFVACPVRDENFQVIGGLGLRLQPDKEFTRILQLGRMGESGETYAFDANGMMLSNSRFDDDMILLGLLPDEDGARSILRMLVRDPGGDITVNHRPTVRRRDMPPTRMVQAAVSRGAGADVEGYNDYRGVTVVGAWTWLPKYGFGVATEIDHAEAYRPLSILQWTFWLLFGLLVVSSLAILLFTLMVARLQREAQKAAIEAQQLGQYRLETKLGAGAMGVVYKARHAMLRRPTAVKMLNVDSVTQQSVARFEREVQITSQLNHPNTVAIYDFGRTPEGVFYYAMEYLDGIDLQQLVERYGPQPVGRVIHLLRQMCGSLYEAHTLGLVHRDIKPANIMLNRWGGEPDVVKVLDFGLVKAFDEENRGGQTGDRGLTGTPLYMSPEAIEQPDSVDGRSDLYALGAVGYYLLSGRPVFEAETMVDLCNMQVGEPAPPLANRVDGGVPAELENALMKCLQKQRGKRPQTARELAVMLAACPGAGDWGVEQADIWWDRHERGQPTESKSTGATTVSREFVATIDH